MRAMAQWPAARMPAFEFVALELTTPGFQSAIVRMSASNAQTVCVVAFFLIVPLKVDMGDLLELEATKLLVCVFRGDPATCTDNIRPPIPI